MYNIRHAHSTMHQKIENTRPRKKYSSRLYKAFQVNFVKNVIYSIVKRSLQLVKVQYKSCPEGSTFPFAFMSNAFNILAENFDFPHCFTQCSSYDSSRCYLHADTLQVRWHYLSAWVLYKSVFGNSQKCNFCTF